jgi:hypothetical protein
METGQHDDDDDDDDDDDLIGLLAIPSAPV